VPKPSRLSAEDNRILDRVAGAFGPVGKAISECHFKAALGEAMSAAQEVNRYLDAAAPWKALKRDPAAAATSVYVALRAIDSLKMLFYPFLPFSSEALHQTLGYDGSLMGRLYLQEIAEGDKIHRVLRLDRQKTVGEWSPSRLPVGQKLRPPKPLFEKLDEKVIEEEVARLQQGATGK
jgi:methionyl-tRNA synthetase